MKRSDLPLLCLVGLALVLPASACHPEDDPPSLAVRSQALASSTPTVGPPARIRCFPSTGECLRGLFLDHWEQNGGEAQFGVPIAAEATEPGEGGWVGRVQWLERARFENHEGTVMEAPLGERLLALKGRPWTARPDDGMPVKGCFLAVTGFRVCEPLLSYWQDHGGTARFGDPITSVEPVFRADGAFVLVQYFHRSRLELSQDGSRVTVGALGKEVLAREQRGAPHPLPGELERDLGETIRGILARFPGDVAVAVGDLETGEEMHVLGERAHKAASSIKLFVIHTALTMLAEGQLKDYEQLRPFIEEIFTWSTNPPATLLLSAIGGDPAPEVPGSKWMFVRDGIPRVNAHMRQRLGMSPTSRLVLWAGVKDPEYKGSPDDDFVYGNNRFTALDAIRSLTRMHRGEDGMLEWNQFMLDELRTRAKYRYLQRGLPSGRDIRAVSKVGFIGPEAYGPEYQAINDFGLVTIGDRRAPSGRPVTYSIAVFVQTDNQAHTAGAAVELIARISRVTFEWFDARYAASARLAHPRRSRR